jgi:hypothetical protein
MNRHQEIQMTASFAPPRPLRQGPSVTVGVVVSLIVGVTAIVLAVAGLTFIGLAIAFPIAIPVAQAYHVFVSPADAALAQHFAGLWWAFLTLGLASFVASAAVVVKLISFLSPGPRD